MDKTISQHKEVIGFFKARESDINPLTISQAKYVFPMYPVYFIFTSIFLLQFWLYIMEELFNEVAIQGS